MKFIHQQEKAKKTVDNDNRQSHNVLGCKVLQSKCLKRGLALKYCASTSTPTYFVDLASNVWQRLHVSVAGDDGLGDPILEADANFPSNSGVTKHYIKLAGLLQNII